MMTHRSQSLSQCQWHFTDRIFLGLFLLLVALAHFVIPATAAGVVANASGPLTAGAILYTYLGDLSIEPINQCLNTTAHHFLSPIAPSVRFTCAGSQVSVYEYSDGTCSPSALTTIANTTLGQAVNNFIPYSCNGIRAAGGNRQAMYAFIDSNCEELETTDQVPTLLNHNLCTLQDQLDVTCNSDGSATVTLYDQLTAPCKGPSPTIVTIQPDQCLAEPKFNGASMKVDCGQGLHFGNGGGGGGGGSGGMQTADSTAIAVLSLVLPVLCQIFSMILG